MNTEPIIPKPKGTPEWYVLYTFPRSEKKVQARLDEQLFETYLPLHKSPRVWSDRVKMIDKPLFSSYLFVRCLDVQLYTLLHIYGVVRIVYYCGRPAVVRQKEIDAIRQFLLQAAERPLCIGEEAEILSGSMKHVSGKILEIKKNRLILSIEQLGATVSVNLSDVARPDRLK
jgi:transcription antitermination factor NusG